MGDDPKITLLKNKHRDELEAGLAELERAAPIIARTCRIYADALEAEGFSPKEICRILGTYLSQT